MTSLRVHSWFESCLPFSHLHQHVAVTLHNQGFFPTQQGWIFGLCSRKRQFYIRHVKRSELGKKHAPLLADLPPPLTDPPPRTRRNTQRRFTLLHLNRCCSPVARRLSVCAQHAIQHAPRLCACAVPTIDMLNTQT